MSKLTPKQCRFVEEYLVDLNATQAAIRAGYSPHRANAIGYENLTKPDIQSAIELARRERSARTGVDADWVVRELYLMASADLAEFVEWGPDGVKIKDSRTLDIARRRAIIEVSETQFGVKIKVADKKGALDLLGRHLGIFGKEEQKESDNKVVVYIPSNGR